MSDIIEARRLLGEGLALQELARQKFDAALRLMWREKPVRRSRAKHVYIDEKTRRAIRKLALDPDISMHEIGNRVGLPNIGRISEVLNGLR